MELPRTIQKPRTGAELLHSDGHNLDVSLFDFWRWSGSDLLSNPSRGVFAEFIVARALNIPLDALRDEWGPFNLKTPDGIRFEVKSAAFVQSWAQVKHSIISFRVPKTRAWNPETNILDPEARRQAQVYVFALLAHKEQESIDPLNVNQWHFYVLPTSVLNERTRSQHSITLRTLDALSGGSVSFNDLREAIRKASLAQ